MEQSLYVDDLVSGGATEQEAFEVYKSSKWILQRGGFNLRKWNTNSTALRGMIQQSESSLALSTQGNESNVTVEEESVDLCKLLGVVWERQQDNFVFDFKEQIHLMKGLPHTKRSVLKITASLFDPLGILSPFVITLKVLFQSLCADKANWDEPIQFKRQFQWQSLMDDLVLLSELKIPRCCFLVTSHPVSICLHGFSDASQHAYAAALYLSSTYLDGHVEVNLLCSKTRVAPTKKQTIPRLELLGALILARLVHSVLPCLPGISKIRLWVDSMVVLHWICNKRAWKQYVQNRVEEIRRLTPGGDWNFCPGELNPADLPSRGVTAKELIGNTLWWHGPSLINEQRVGHPLVPDIDVTCEVEAELSRTQLTSTHAMINVNKEHKRICLDELIDCTHYSNLDMLLRVTAYVRLFVARLEKHRTPRCETDPLIDARDIKEAESAWIISVQLRCFEKEVLYLLTHRGACPILVHQFNLYLDDDQLMRCQGRIGNSELAFTSKKPALLPTRHPFVTLLIRRAHESSKHSGINDTLTLVRERYWVLRGRRATKEIVKSCVTCRRIEGHPYTSSPAAELPSERVSEDPPFSHSGIDFAGPLYISSNGTAEKTYICLFTCAATRAVHLELVRDMGVESFLLCFRRFASRRGLPATLITDNAKTFRASSKEVLKIARASEVQRYLANNHTSWKFIAEKAPWWGGFWERLIQSVKRSLKKVLGRTTLNFDQLNTLLVEVEGVINSRPLTYVEDDTSGASYVLSPSHLIYGRKITSAPNDSHFEVISSNDTLTRRARQQKHLLSQFTRQWRKEYLIGLRENHKSEYRSRGMGGAKIALGDVVVIKDNQTKRSFWKLGVVEELLSGPDGHVRAARVRAGNSDRRSQVFRRSVKHLYPIEVSSNENVLPSSGERNSTIATDMMELRDTRSRRDAAIIGERRRRMNT